MVKLDERRIRWIVQQKLRGAWAADIALIQHVSRRRVEQVWEAYRRDGAIPTLKKPGRPRKALVDPGDVALILAAYDEFKVNALTLERVLKHNYGRAIPHKLQ